MKRTILCILIAFTCAITTKAQNNLKVNYTEHWQKIDDLMSQQRLPVSALAEIQKVYNLALSNKAYDQVVKAIVYRMNAQGQIQGNTTNVLLDSLKLDAQRLPQPAKSMVYSIIAEVYKSYYQNKQWQIARRTSVDIVDDDIATWDIKRLFTEAIKYYKLSIQDEEALKQVPTDDYKEALYYYYSYSSSIYVPLLPTLYDFLLFRTIKAFEGEMSAVLPQQAFVLNKPEYFADAQTFAAYNIVSTDTLSAEYVAITLYQKLINFRMQQLKSNPVPTNLYALINIDIERLKYLRNKGRYTDNNAMYEKALRQLMEKYTADAEWEYPAYALANLYNEQAANWKTTKDDKLRWKYKEAYDLCTQIINKNGKLTYFASDLQDEIKSPSARLTIANVQYPNSPILALAEYRNVSKLYLSFYNVSDEFIIKSKRYSDYNLNEDYFADKKPYKTQQITPPLPTDFQPYSAEIKIDALPQGHYVVFVSQDPVLSNEDGRNKLIANTVFQVSPLTFVSRVADSTALVKFTNKLNNNNNDGVIQLYVADSKTGEPVQRAKIDVYSPEERTQKMKSHFYYTDNNGMAYFDNNRDIERVTISKGDNRLLTTAWNNAWYNNNDQDVVNKVVLFTDRSIYRPGQTVYYKALNFKTNNDGENKLLPKANLTIYFLDVNYKTIASQTLTTNEYGTIQGSFTIPQGLLNGNMMLNSEYGGYTYIQVEEYKRPTFEVKFDAVKDNYKLNDNIKVSGVAKALAGYAVDNSKVQYRVTRSAEYRYFYWWFMPRTDAEREIASGEVTTDSKGVFKIDFKAEADDVEDNNLIYNYKVVADITDVNGETRSATLAVRVSNKPLMIASSIPAQIEKNSDSFSFDFTTTNLNGDFTPADVEVTLTALKSPETILLNRLWSAPDTVALSRGEFKKYFPIDPYGNENQITNYPVIKQVSQIKFNTKNNKKIDLSVLQKEKSGWYRVDMKAKNESGVEISQQSYLSLLSSEPEPITTMSSWLTVIKNSGEPNDSAEFWVAGGEKQSTIRYEVVLNDRIIEQKTLVTGTTPQRVIIPIKEKYRGGFDVQFIMLQNGRSYVQKVNVNVPYTNKQLDVKFTTFRDKLLPGEQEKWTLTVKNKAGEQQMAEMAATLYDASLEVFRPHSWSDFESFYPQRTSKYYLQWKNMSYTNIVSTYYYSYEEYKASLFMPVYPFLNMFGGRYMGAFYNTYSDTDMQTKSALMGSVARIAVNDEPLQEVVAVAYGARKEDAGAASKQVVIRGTGSSPAAPSPAQEPMASNAAEAGGGSEPPTTPLTEIATRQNFNETAFFYPQLRTNEEGEIIIDFTIPEALTRWRMLGFAHTKDLKIGTVTNELVTQKQVAISANAPRFFREGDVIELTAKVNNITDTEFSGQALLRVYDATTLQPIDAQVITTPATQAFTIKAGESTGVKWTLKIPTGIQAITYKVTAQAGNHTDGEEKVVPVLTNSMLVTETMPFSIRAGKQKDFVFKRLKDNKSTTLRNHKLTLEFTSNPAWYAVQAMPYLMEYPYECAEQVFSRFYANSLSSTIVNSSPRVKQIFDLWSKIPENKDALLSNLEKNQELKQVMLEETPWVMQAQNETERKKRIGLLFDLNKMSGEQQRAFDKLKKAQLGNGGFAWFNGLEPSRYITQHIVAGIEHLAKLNALGDDYKTDARAMVTNGLVFLDSKMTEDYNYLLKSKADLTKQQISAIHLHYLYACSFSEHKPQNEAQRKAFDYYYGQAEKYWMNFATYGQAMTALLLKRYGSNATAEAIVRSLKERAIQSEEMGMYWSDNVAGYFWYQAPIETQALLIEVFNEVANDKQSVEELKIWLLRNKQTNDWRTTKATAEACYALLMTGTNLIDESSPLEIQIGGKPLAQATTDDIRPEPGTGYVKTAWNGNNITNNMATLNVNNPNKSGIAWGGMYWQYFEQLDKITSAETKLKMNKKLFLKKITERGAELVPLDEKNVLKVGDVVTIRMELRADRDYEYVHLKDMRAAGFEPTKAISGYRYQDGLFYYESIKDASTNFFISYLRKGTYVFEYELRVTHAGQFSNGITTFQCMYAPEFSAHSEGIRVTVE